MRNPYSTPLNTIKSIAFGLTSTALLLLSGCVYNLPTLIDVARERQNPADSKNLPNAPYKITDRDVLDYADRIEHILLGRFRSSSSVRYGSSATQVTLSALAGVASAAGWSVATASGLGAGSTYIASLGQTFNAKADAQAYQTSFDDIQAAEATYYFHQVGGKVVPGTGGKVTAQFPASAQAAGVPRNDVLTADGETLFYRIVSVIKVLEAAESKKIPDLQSLKDAKGDSSTTSTTGAGKEGTTQ